MKKLLLALILPFSICFATPTVAVARAEDEIVETTESAESVETSEIVSSEESVVATETSEQEKENKIDIAELTDKVKQLLNDNFTADTILKAVSIIVDIGLVLALLIVLKKNRKLSSENQKAFKNEVLKQSKEVNDKIENQIDELNNNYNTIIKAIVLAQDKTADGKLALLDLIATAKATKKEVVEKAVEVKEKVVEEKKQKEKVIDKVKNDYIPID
jgi:predicted PurR-regulated permease PerM